MTADTASSCDSGGGSPITAAVPAWRQAALARLTASVRAARVCADARAGR